MRIDNNFLLSLIEKKINSLSVIEEAESDGFVDLGSDIKSVMAAIENPKISARDKLQVSDASSAPVPAAPVPAAPVPASAMPTAPARIPKGPPPFATEIAGSKSSSKYYEQIPNHLPKLDKEIRTQAKKDWPSLSEADKKEIRDNVFSIQRILISKSIDVGTDNPEGDGLYGKKTSINALKFLKDREIKIPNFTNFKDFIKKLKISILNNADTPVVKTESKKFKQNYIRKIIREELTNVLADHVFNKTRK